MKITVTKIKRELEKKGWDTESLEGLYSSNLIKATRDIIDEQLRVLKNITIKK